MEKQDSFIQFPLHTIVSLNSWNNQRLCNVLVQLIGCFFSNEHSVCVQNGAFCYFVSITNSTKRTTTQPHVAKLTKTKAFGWIPIINLMNWFLISFPNQLDRLGILRSRTFFPVTRTHAKYMHSIHHDYVVKRLQVMYVKNIKLGSWFIKVLWK